jgi:hypothetical protein
MMKVGGPAAANSSFTGFGARSIDELDKRTVKRCAVDDDHSRGELRAGRLGRNRSEDRSSASRRWEDVLSCRQFDLLGEYIP